MDLIIPEENKSSPQVKRITKIFTQYIVCRNEDTGEMWIEGARCFPTRDSFAKKVGFNKTKPKPKMKELPEFIENEEEVI